MKNSTGLRKIDFSDLTSAQIKRVAEKVGTPLYLYSQSMLETNYRKFDSAFNEVPHLTCYAVKANSNLAVLSLFRRLGSGFDIVSGGELRRALKAGADPGKIVFSGVGKASSEVDLALSQDIFQFNVESAAELEILESRARATGRTARLSFRVNPDVDPQTHPYIATGLSEHKFGISIGQVGSLFERTRASKHLKAIGIAAHIGSQITRVRPFVDSIRKLKSLVSSLRSAGFEIESLNLGGGLGITYRDEVPPDPVEYARALVRRIRGFRCRLILEPGRVVVGNAGILVTRVLLIKKNGTKNFVVVDAAMNDLIRPTLYGSYHRILPVGRPRRGYRKVDVVGPVCESGDFLARDRRMPVVQRGDLLAILCAGAYGFVFSSNYNARPRAPEVLARNGRFKVVRKRETFDEMIQGESTNPL